MKHGYGVLEIEPGMIATCLRHNFGDWERTRIQMCKTAKMKQPLRKKKIEQSLFNACNGAMFCSFLGDVKVIHNSLARRTCCIIQNG